MTNREALLRKISTAQFAAWELHIYLNTHIDDPEAVRKFKTYNEEAKALTKEYESKYGPLTIEQGDGSSWIKDPWPWEITGGTK